MPVSRVSHIIALGVDLKGRARRYDRAISVIEGLATALATILMAVGGFYNDRPTVGPPCLVAGAVACILSIALIVLRQRGALEHVAGALAAAAEADVRRSDAAALRMQASAELTEARRAREAAIARAGEAEQKNATLTAEASKAAQRADKAKAKLARLDSSLAQVGGDLHRQRRLVDNQRNHRQLMLLAFSSMHDAAEKCPLDLPLREVIEAILDAACHNVISAFGCSPTERWTLSIYGLEDKVGAEVMVRSYARSWDRMEEHDKRVWGRGEGYTGAAWKRGAPVVESDTRVPEIAAKYFVPTGKFQPEDVDLYVSVAAEPIRVPGPKSGRDRICGVIVATSDKVGRFLRNPSDPLAQNAELVHQLERIIAVQIALRRDASHGAFKQS